MILVIVKKVKIIDLSPIDWRSGKMFPQACSLRNFLYLGQSEMKKRIYAAACLKFSYQSLVTTNDSIVRTDRRTSVI